MANMSYCRFENTFNDLKDCLQALADRDIQSDREKKMAVLLVRQFVEYLNEECLLTEDGELDEKALAEIIEECGGER